MLIFYFLGCFGYCVLCYVVILLVSNVVTYIIVGIVSKVSLSRK